MSEVSSEDFRRLREELRETREIAYAVLLAIVGKDKALTWKIEAAVEDRMQAEIAGPPLREVIGHANSDRIYKEFRIGSIRPLRQLRRDDVAGLRGIGPAAMQKLDGALQAEGVAWGDWA